ncbi:MAG: choice-of-anchor X domain-containing protein [Candidatus Eisenbacteria bacterium]
MKLFAATMALAMLLVPGAALALPSIAGNFQGWDPADPASELTLNGNGVYVLTIAAGDSLHEYKAIDGDAWGEAFPPDPNQAFTPATPENVTFFVNLGAVPGTKQGDEYVFHSLNPPIVCGTLQSTLGGSDWDQTDTSTTVMSDGDLDDVWEFSSVIPTGSYECKIVLNNNWQQNTSPANIPFGSDGVNPVTFKYYMATNTTEIITAAAPTVISAPIDYDGTAAGLLSVRFSKDVEQVSAETEANYAITGGPSGPYTVATATLDGSNASLVHLDLTTALTEGYDYTVTVTGVTDLASTPVDPTANTACFYLHRVDFEINMSLYIDANGVPTSLHVQGDTYPLTWDLCGGAETLDAGGDSTYAVTEYFTMHYTCGASAESTQVKYKYVVDCLTWEGDFDFGHFVTLDPNAASQVVNVWWNDVAPVDNIACDVGVLFQVHDSPACASGLFVRGTALPLDWSTGVELLDDGTGGDVTASDGIYSAEVLFPTGTYKFLQYKYFCADSDTTGTYECDVLPNRNLTLDDVDGCMALRAGPMVLEDLWNWCETVPGISIEPMSWGQIKSLYRRD